MSDINTETKLDMDYFSKGETKDTNTVRNFLREYEVVAGFYVDYYKQQDPNLFMDKVFLEKGDKKYCKPIKIKVIMEYLQEVIETMKYAAGGILDELNVIVEKTYFEDTIKSKKPLIGDIICIPYASNLFFSCVNVVDVDGLFFGQKLTWKLTCKVWLEGHEDTNISDDAIEPGYGNTSDGGWEPDKENSNVNEPIQEEAEDLDPSGTVNPFGNY